MKDLFTGALGRLNNHGGSKIYTTPNTILVPPEYEIEIGEHGIFISCSLDGRLWLFEDRIIALKWNKEAGEMEYAASKSFSDENFVAHGRDWILTDKSVIQITDNSPYIFHEAHNENVTPMEHFYSLLPALNGFQIIKNYLIRKPNEDYENLMYPISMPDIYLTFYENTIWARTQSGIGKVLITENDGAYSLDFEYSYNFSDNSWQNMGIAFINDDIFGFKVNQNNKTLCPCSEDTQLYSIKNSSWLDLSGNIFFDPFNRSGVVINNNGINLLANEKSIECKGLSQWIAPAKQIQSIDDNTIISSVDNSVLATYLSLGFYRYLIKNKEIPITTSFYNISLGIDKKNKIHINNFNIDDIKFDIDIKLLNITDNYRISAICLHEYYINENGEYDSNPEVGYLAFFDEFYSPDASYRMNEDLELDVRFDDRPLFEEILKKINIKFRKRDIYAVNWHTYGCTFEYIDEYTGDEEIECLGTRISIIFEKGKIYYQYKHLLQLGGWFDSLSKYDNHDRFYDAFYEKSDYMGTIYHYYLINPDTGNINEYYNNVYEDNYRAAWYPVVYNNCVSGILGLYTGVVQINPTKIYWKTPSDKTRPIINFKQIDEDNIYFQGEIDDYLIIKKISIDNKYKILLEQYPNFWHIQTFINPEIENEFINIISFYRDDDDANVKVLLFVFRTKFIKK